MRRFGLQRDEQAAMGAQRYQLLAHQMLCAVDVQLHKRHLRRLPTQYVATVWTSTVTGRQLLGSINQLSQSVFCSSAKRQCISFLRFTKKSIALQNLNKRHALPVPAYRTD